MHSRELLDNVKKLKNSVGDLDQLQIGAAANIVDALNGVKTSVEQVEVSLAGYATEEFVTNKISEAKLDGKVDLSNYVTKSQLDLKADGTALTSHTDNTIVHITAAERTTWNAKSNFSGNYNDLTNKPTIPSAYVHPSSHAATMITEDENHKFVTDAEKSAWNAKSNFSGNYNDLTNKPTIPSAYTHPSSHAATMITEDSTHRFVTDTEKSTWNAKSDLILGTTSSTAFRGDQGNTAYTHSQAAHAPANAQANADITKEEIEAKLTGNIISHTHSQYIDDTELGTKVLTKDNTIEYTPTGDYNPVTKKYVDENFIKKADQYPYEPVEGDIPKVYFIGNGNFLPKTKSNVKMQMKYVSKTLNFECWINIKCQGTSSMSYDKKNFSIRLYEDEGLTTKLKMNFKNWGSQYKYVLKANYIDLTHARNVVSAKLWGKCVKTRSNFNELPEQLRTSPNLGAIDGFFIKVYYDGMYQGRYTFNIPKDPWMTNMDTNLEQHCLLCAENYDSGCFRAPAVIDETDWTDEIHKQCPDSIKTRWNEVINFVRTSNDTDFKNNLSSYFDVESLIDYYCFQYLICGLDSLGKNQVYITYDGNLWYATSYDMDSTWGLYWDGSRTISPAYRMPADYETGVHGTSNLLYDRLEKLFKQEIYDRYRVLREGPMEIMSVISEFEQFMEVCDESIIREDYAIFPGIPGQSFSNLQQIRNYAIDRFRYVDDCMQAFIAEEVTAGKLYELPQATTFNGTSDYIDTGIKLFDTAKDFTLIVNGYMQNLSQAFNTPILHCMQESGEYPGLSIQNMGNSSYGVQGAPGEYFPGHNIDTNRIKFAITCRNGIVQELRMKRDKGVESYRIKSGTYNQVDKTLVIGAYKTDSGTYGRYWSGTISNFVVYNEALSGGQISNILNNMAFPRTIRSNYSPSGASFSDTISDVDFNAEELYITVDLSTCTGTNECVLSFGNNIGTWSNAYCIHLYYTKSTNTMLLDNQHINLTQTISGTMTVIFNSDGLKVNDTLYSPTNRLTFSNISGLRTLAVGSTEGSNRSHASNYNISIRPKTTL